MPLACSIEGCARKYMALGYCNPHYQSFRKYGDPIRAKRVAPPAKNHKMGRGYVGVGGRYEHIVIAEKALGKALPPKAVVHHFDGNPANNSPDNLVICPDQRYHFLLHSRQRDILGMPFRKDRKNAKS